MCSNEACRVLLFFALVSPQYMHAGLHVSGLYHSEAIACVLPNLSKAYWEDVAWVVPATTSKLLTLPHSHIKEMLSMLRGSPCYIK